MKIDKFIIIILFLVSCNTYNTSWERNTTIRGIEFEKFRYGLNENGDTISATGILTKNTSINNIPCAATWVSFRYPQWSLEDFQLYDKKTLNNFEYPAGSWIMILEDNEIICVFPEDTEVQGFPVKGGGGSKGIQSHFYLSGKLQYFYPTKDITIDKIACKESLLEGVGLYESGNLKSCKLAENVKINDKLYKKGTNVEFDEAGNIIKSN